MKWNTGDSPSKWLIRRVNSQCDASVKWDGDLPELSPVLLKMGANQATLIDRWDRKEEPLIAFAAASFRSIYKGLDGTVLLSVFLRGKRGLLSNSRCSFLRVGSFFEMV